MTDVTKLTGFAVVEPLTGAGTASQLSTYAVMDTLREVTATNLTTFQILDGATRGEVIAGKVGGYVLLGTNERLLVDKLTAYAVIVTGISGLQPRPQIFVCT